MYLHSLPFCKHHQEGPLGECESIYLVTKTEEQEQMKVQKVRNYDHCRSRIRYEEGLLTSLTVSPLNTPSEVSYYNVFIVRAELS